MLDVSEQVAGLTDLLRCQAHAVRCVHRLDHVRGQFPNPIVDFFDLRFATPQTAISGGSYSIVPMESAAWVLQNCVFSSLSLPSGNDFSGTG